MQSLSETRRVFFVFLFSQVAAKALSDCSFCECTCGEMPDEEEETKEEEKMDVDELVKTKLLTTECAPHTTHAPRAHPRELSSHSLSNVLLATSMVVTSPRCCASAVMPSLRTRGTCSG